jgi:hypothetical protein
MSYDLSPTILTEVAQQGNIVAPYSTLVYRFRHMSYDLSPTILTEVAQQGNIVAPRGWHCFAKSSSSHCIVNKEVFNFGAFSWLSSAYCMYC